MDIATVPQNYKDDIEDYWGKHWETLRSQGFCCIDITDKKTVYRFKFFVKPILEKLAVGSKICEIGSGNCQWLLLIKSYRPDLRLFGIDLSPTAVKIGNSLGIEMIECDIRDIPVEDEFYDFVYSWGVIEHMVESDVALKEQYRISKKWVVADVPFDGSPAIASLKKTIKARGLTDYEAMIEYGRFFTRKDFKKLVCDIAEPGDKVTFKNNYWVFTPHIIGRFLDNVCPEFIRGRMGHNIGTVIEKV